LWGRPPRSRSRALPWRLRGRSSRPAPAALPLRAVPGRWHVYTWASWFARRRGLDIRGGEATEEGRQGQNNRGTLPGRARPLGERGARARGVRDLRPAGRMRGAGLGRAEQSRQSARAVRAVCAGSPARRRRGHGDLRCMSAAPCSSYSFLLNHIWWKDPRDARMEPPGRWGLGGEGGLLRGGGARQRRLVRALRLRARARGAGAAGSRARARGGMQRRPNPKRRARGRCFEARKEAAHRSRSRTAVLWGLPATPPARACRRARRPPAQPRAAPARWAAGRRRLAVGFFVFAG
jgi:hypothetical protein